ncbi:MAG: class I tRNA ligase family protein, partial [bacterium]|nr:class I tRNA ligase family protein [bacterium]
MIFIQKFLFNLEINKKVPFKHIDLHPILFEKRGKKMGLETDELLFSSVFIQEYGSDVLRMFLSQFDISQIEYYPQLDKIPYYYQLNQKLWNASRFVHKKWKEQEGEKSISFPKLNKEIQSLIADFGQFDLWIVHILQG